jgi:hypothetical protein
MHKRDLLMRQFEEFGKFLATILGYKQQQDFIEVSKLISEGALKYIGVSRKEVEELEPENLISSLTQEKKLTDEQLKMLADLLYENGVNNLNGDLNSDSNTLINFTIAQMLYNFVNLNGTLPYSLDTHYKLDVIKDILK